MKPLTLRDRWYLLKLLSRKRKDLQDVKCDIAYMEEVQEAFRVEESIKDLRSELKKANEAKRILIDNGKDTSEVDESIRELSYKIAMKENVQNNYKQMVDSKKGLEKYVELIHVWLEDGLLP